MIWLLIERYCTCRGYTITDAFVYRAEEFIKDVSCDDFSRIFSCIKVRSRIIKDPHFFICYTFFSLVIHVLYMLYCVDHFLLQINSWNSKNLVSQIYRINLKIDEYMFLIYVPFVIVSDRLYIKSKLLPFSNRFNVSFAGTWMSSVDAISLHQYKAMWRAVGSDSRYFQNYQMPPERFQARDGRKTAFVFADGVSECSSRS